MKKIEKLNTRQIIKDNLSNESPELLKKVIVLVHNIRSLHNVGSIFRSSDAFGIKKIVLSGYSPTPPRAEISKTAIGAEEFVKWKYFEDPINYLSELKREGYSLIGLEQTTESVMLPDFNVDSNDKLCLIIGNEVTGIDNSLLEIIDTFVAIPQFGQKHSLNVSVATAVLLYALLEKVENE